MIRPAVPSDLKAVLRISKASFHGEDAFGATWLVNMLANPGTTLLVDDAALSIIRGYLVTEQHQLGTVARLIAVDPDFRKCGVGKALLANVKGPAYTWIRTENEASQALVKSLGWVEMDPPRKRKGDWLYFHLAAANQPKEAVCTTSAQPSSAV